jgi:cytochrome c oxidase subunit 2
MIESLIQPASTYASDIDQVVNLVGVMVFFWGGLTALVFFVLLWRFRYKEGVPALYIHGSEPELKRWITIPHYLIILCDVVIIAAAVRVWYNVKQNLPEPAAQYGVYAQQWAWSFVHPGRDNVLGTADDIKTVDELHVEVDKVSHVKLYSRDVLHSFSVPVFRLKQDVIPGREITQWFQPTVPGTFDIQCTEMCGIGHGIMAARIIVHTHDSYVDWVESVSPAP